MPQYITMKRSITFLIGIFISTAVLAEDNWNQFRGPTGRGHSTDKNVPEKWSANDVKWSTDLPGTGQSSPVNWGDKVFLTSAEEMGKVRHIFCLDLKTGKELWRKTIPCENPERFHKMNSSATPSCATDGERVYAFFGPTGFACFKMDGTPVWKQPLGDFPGDWGIASSPILLGDNLVLQNCDCSGPSRLVAMDRKTGDIKWETEREAKPKGGWSTPIVINFDGQQEIVLNGEFGVRGYDPKTGAEKWFCKGFNGRGAPVPDFADNALFVVNGKPGDLYSVKPGGSGDVTKSHMVWHTGRKAKRDLPSPAVVGDYMLTVSMPGIATCFDTKTGKIHWNQPLGIKGEFAGSPLVANGLVYFTSVYGGDTVVIKPGKTMEIVATNSVGAKQDEIFRSTIAPINGQLLIRSQTRLYCVGK